MLKSFGREGAAEKQAHWECCSCAVCIELQSQLAGLNTLTLAQRTQSSPFWPLAKGPY